MTAHDVTALRLLATMKNLVGPGYFGSCLWPDTKRPTWAFARPAGRVLNRLKKEGYAEWLTTGPHRSAQWGWQITPLGRRALSKVIYSSPTGSEAVKP